MSRAPEAIGKLLGLTSKTCAPEHSTPLSEKERERLRNQVSGWRVSNNDAGGTCLRYDWTAQVWAPTCCCVNFVRAPEVMQQQRDQDSLSYAADFPRGTAANDNAGAYASVQHFAHVCAAEAGAACAGR